MAAAGSAVRLRPTVPSDLDFVCALEARPDFEAFIFRWPPETHLAALTDPDLCHLMVCDTAARPLGFAVMAGLRAGDGAVELKRIALDRPGDGLGRAVLPLLLAQAFDVLQARRLWLDVFADNLRARRAYLRAGFVEATGPRATAPRAGQAVPLIVMAMELADYRRGGPDSPRDPGGR